MRGMRSVKLTANYSGDSNFIVGLVNFQGEYVDNAFNEIGALEAQEATLDFEDSGWYFIQIETEGEFTLNLKLL